MTNNTCRHCGQAEYVEAAESQVYNWFGLRGPNPQNIKLWRCPKCGHVEFFYAPPEEK